MKPVFHLHPPLAQWTFWNSRKAPYRSKARQDSFQWSRTATKNIPRSCRRTAECVNIRVLRSDLSAPHLSHRPRPVSRTYRTYSRLAILEGTGDCISSLLLLIFPSSSSPRKISRRVIRACHSVNGRERHTSGLLTIHSHPPLPLPPSPHPVAS